MSSEQKQKQREFDNEALSLVTKFNLGFENAETLKEKLIDFRTDLWCLGIPYSIPDRVVSRSDRSTWYTANEIVEAYHDSTISMLVKIELLYKTHMDFKAQCLSRTASEGLKVNIRLLRERWIANPALHAYNSVMNSSGEM